jgi:cell division protein FtsW
MPRSAAAERRNRQPLESNVLLTATLCLLAFGAVMVYSASSARTLLEGSGDGSGYLVRYLAYGAVGVVLMHLVSRRRLDLVVRATGPLLAVAFLCLIAVRIPGVGVQINGARRWLGAGPLQFQPSEVAKLALVLYSVRVLAERPGRLRRPAQIRPLLLVTGVAILLVATQPDLGTALVMGATVTALLVAAGLPVRHLAVGAAGAAGLVFVYALSAEYRRDRLMTFMNPWDHASDAGFQAVQGQIAMGSGGILGRGLGQSQQKNLFLPEAHTDFVLAIIGEELGVAGVFALIFLYGLLAYAGLRVARRASGAYAKLLAAGVTSLILCQAALNMFAILGLAPLTGVPLPFISYGSTNLVVLLGAVGLLLNVAGGGSVHLRALSGARDRAGSARGRDVSDRRGRDGRARGAGRGGRRRAAG